MNEIIKIEQSDLTKINQEKVNTYNELIFSFLGSKAKSTRKIYESHLKEFFRFMDEFSITDFKEVKYSHIIAYRESLIKKSLSDNTINIKLATVRSFFTFLNMPTDSEGNSHLSSNVTQYVKKIKVDPYSHSQTFDIELFKKIVKDLDEKKLIELRDKIIFLLFGYCGLRKSEVTSLKVSSIKEELGIAYYKVVGKGNKVIEKELPPIVYELIIKLIEKMNLKTDDYLFHSLSNNKITGQRLANNAINRLVDKYVRKYGFSKSFKVHSLRSLSAKEVYLKTKDIVLTQKHLNHANIATTQIYLNKLGESKKVGYYNKMFNW